MTINTPYLNVATGRNFAWLDRGERMAAKDQLPSKDKPKGNVRELTGRASRKEESEPKFPLDNPDATLHIYEWTADTGNQVPLERWYWKINWSGKSEGGYASSREDAADQCYRAFYRIGTAIKFATAKLPKAGMQIVILGHWADAHALSHHKRKDMLTIVPDVVTDTRDDALMFVVGGTVKKLCLIKEAKLLRNAAKDSTNPQDWEITLQSGTRLSGSLDWYVYKPELMVQGEVACPKCGTAGGVQSLQMRCVRGQSALCGPCLDFGLEHGEISEDLVDMETVTL